MILAASCSPGSLYSARDIIGCIPSQYDWASNQVFGVWVSINQYCLNEMEMHVEFNINVTVTP